MQRGKGRPIILCHELCKNEKLPYLSNSLIDPHHATFAILPNKTADIIKQNWNQFLLVVKAAALKQ